MEARLRLGRMRTCCRTWSGWSGGAAARAGARPADARALPRRSPGRRVVRVRRARSVLGEELGLEPGPDLRALELAILRQDTALDVEPAELRERRRLPAPATPLIGRRRQVGEVRDLLAVPRGS